MSWYRAYFLNDRRRIADVEEFRSNSDAQAVEQAEALTASRRDAFGFELWQGARPIVLYPQPQVEVA